MIIDFKRRARMGALATLASALALSACTTTGGSGEPASASAKAEDKFAATKAGDPVFASTYKPFPNVATALKGATVYDGKGGKIENGVVFMSGGKIVAVGGPDTPIPADIAVFDGTGKFVTPGIIDIHSHLGDYPSPGVEAHSDGNEATAPTTPPSTAQSRSRRWSRPKAGSRCAATCRNRHSFRCSA